MSCLLKGVRMVLFLSKTRGFEPRRRCAMRFVLVAFAAFAMSGCFSTAMGLRSRSGSMIYEAEGLLGPTPMEAASADLVSAQADRVRAEARTMEAHPELFMGWRGGYGGYGRVDPSYYYPTVAVPPPTAATTLPALETRATGLETRASGLEEEADELEDLLREHIAEERSQP